jgi:hypothetical protein
MQSIRLGCLFFDGGFSLHQKLAEKALRPAAMSVPLKQVEHMAAPTNTAETPR